MENQTRFNWDEWLKIIIGILLANILLYLGLAAFDKPEEYLASLGSFVGISSALFTGLAFMGLMRTIHQQQEALELQRHELAATRQELAAASEAQREVASAQQKHWRVSRLSAEIQAQAAILASFAGSIAGDDAREVLRELSLELKNERQAEVGRLDCRTET